MNTTVVEEVIKNISAVLLQFKTEEMGNRVTQFNYLSLERYIVEELAKLRQMGEETTGGNHEQDSNL